MKNWLVVFFSAVILLGACSKEEMAVDSKSFITHEGKDILLDGTWQSDCIQFPKFHLKEYFVFDGDQLQIIIERYENGSCDQNANKEIVSIQFIKESDSQILFDNQKVNVNHISGTTSFADGSKEKFKQTIYIDDRSERTVLYHGIFEDDGGAVNRNGFPISLHPFPIKKQ